MALRPALTMPSLWLLAIVIVGAALRLSGLWFGLPYLLARPDEDVAVGIPLRMLATGDLNPHFFHWPSFTFYLFAALYFVADIVKGWVGSEGPLSAQDHLLLSRGCIALAGTATLPLVYVMGKRIADEATGLIAAALLAVAPLHVRESHFAMTDILMTFLVTGALALFLRAIDEGRGRTSLRWFAAAGFAAGVAASAKYSAAAIVGPILAVFFSRTTRNFLAVDAWGPSAGFGIAFAFGFFATTPYALFDYEAFLEGVRFNTYHLAEGQNVRLGRGWIYHLTTSVPLAVGWSTFGAAIVGAALSWRRHARYAAALGSFGALLYLLIGSGQLVFFRYILPLVPIACIAAAVAIREGARWSASHFAIPRACSFALLVLMAAMPGLIRSIWLDILLTRTDSRVIAARWLQEHHRPGENVYDAGGKYVALDLNALDVRRLTFDKATGTFIGSGGREPDWLIVPQSPLFTHTKVDPRILAIADRNYTLRHTVPATAAGATSGVYDLQDAFFLPIAGLADVYRPGPTIHIYRRAVALR